MTDISEAPRRPRAPVVPAHYRLSKESWDEIVEAYRNGATARELAVKWKVAPGSVYYHACRDGWGKKKNGDDRARAHARAVEAADAVRAETMHDDKAARLFDGIDDSQDEDDEADHFLLARAATRASGRAMRGRLWNEAKALAGLAEAYARLNDRAVSAPPTAARMDLEDLLDIIMLAAPGIYDRFRIDSDKRDDPDGKLKTEFWNWHRGVWGRGQTPSDPLSAEAALHQAIAALETIAAASHARMARARGEDGDEDGDD